MVGKGILAAGNKLAKLYCVKVKSDKTKVKYNNELRLKKERNLRIKTIRLLFILLPTHWAILIILSLSQEIIQKIYKDMD